MIVSLGNNGTPIDLAPASIKEEVKALAETRIEANARVTSSLDKDYNCTLGPSINSLFCFIGKESDMEKGREKERKWRKKGKRKEMKFVLLILVDWMNE